MNNNHDQEREEGEQSLNNDCSLDDEVLLESFIGFEPLFISMYKCKKGVLWKRQVANYYLHGVENTIQLTDELHEGTYEAAPQHEVPITYPKPRTAVGIVFRDRTYQRSLNDNVIYPLMTKSFVKGNVACQKNKGPTMARNLLDDYLKDFYRHHGLCGYVLQGDIHGYYPNMSHRVAEESFKKKLPPIIYDKTETILHTQYSGEKGYAPGSQMIQIAGISVLSPLDHFIKEKLHIKYYMRYMDDFILIHESKEYLEWCYKQIEKFLLKYEFELHPKKTRLFELSEGIMFIGFRHKLTNTGKVVRLINPENVKHERKRLYRQVQKAKRGEMTRAEVDACFKSWKAHARHGNSEKLIHRMNEYYKSLWTEGDS